MNALEQALRFFVRAYEGQPALIAEQRGWSPVIAVQAIDADARAAVTLSDGKVAAIGGGEAPTLEISGELQTLCDVLELRRDPNEPYLFGEVVVRGPEADFLRLDYIASKLCAK
jgi:hypothetical protein